MSVIAMVRDDDEVCARMASVAGGGSGGGNGIGGLEDEPMRACPAESRGFHLTKTEGSCRSGDGALGQVRN